MSTRAGFVALIGEPNAGKSTAEPYGGGKGIDCHP